VKNSQRNIIVYLLTHQTQEFKKYFNDYNYSIRRILNYHVLHILMLESIMKKFLIRQLAAHDANIRFSPSIGTAIYYTCKCHDQNADIVTDTV